jgi:hypothetical protein
MTETNALPSRRDLDELTVRLDLVGRFIEEHGNSAGYENEALSIAEAMVKRACELRNTLAARKGTNKPLTLDQLRDTLSGMSLAAVVRDYDRALNDLQNAIGDQVHEREVANEVPDSAGRDTLDALEAVHLRLHNVMRELVGAAAL